MKDFLTKALLLFCLVFTIASCNKAEEEMEPPKNEEAVAKPDPLGFEVKLKNTTIPKVGDTVRFTIEGNANLVSFYSGAKGNDYAYSNKERFYDVLASLSFQSNKTPANATNVDCAKLLYSTDFDGNYAYANVKAATWIPITNRFFLQTQLQPTANDYADSGIGNISDIFASGKPVYIAWYCTTEANANRTQFRVQNLKMTGAVPEDPTLSGDLFTQAQFNFKWVLNSAAAAQTSNLPTITSTQVLWNGVFNNLTGPFKEGYAISAPLSLPQYNAGKDLPTTIILKAGENSREYKFVYKKAGDYEAVFIAATLASGSGEQVVKKVAVKVSN